jgi:hypothetical protein
MLLKFEYHQQNLVYRFILNSCLPVFSRPAENRISFKSELRNFLERHYQMTVPPVIISTLSLKLLEFNSIKI